MSFGRFKVDLSGSSRLSATTLAPVDVMIPVLSSRTTFVSDLSAGLQVLKSDPVVTIKYGDYASDLRSGKFNKSWKSWVDFERFLEDEQNRLSIEFRKVKTMTGKQRYLERRRFLCSRGHTGGRKAYEKKNPHWKRKVEKKCTGCKCCLDVKTYHGIDTVLGRYRQEHNHPVGVENLKFTRHSRRTVRGKVASDHTLESPTSEPSSSSLKRKARGVSGDAHEDSNSEVEIAKTSFSGRKKAKTAGSHSGQPSH